MGKRKGKFKCKQISILLFEEEDRNISDSIFVKVNSKGKLNIYSRLKISGKNAWSFPICWEFTNTKCEEALEENIRNVILQNPYASTSDIEEKTHHSRATINRYYMRFRRELKKVNEAKKT
ncbi:MAG TPA: hypothetical protein DHV62_00640 [Elusimicrobia bacterium]|nr:hypothetical protein [Elusimicrobiota bacterium]